MMPEIRHVVFDIGKVLIHYDPSLPYADIIPDPERRRWFLETVCTNDWNLEQDRGRSWSEAEAELVRRFPEEESNIRAFRARWHDMVPHPYEDSVALLDRLIADGHDVTLLTNFAADTFREAQKKFPFLTRTRGVTVSGEIGLVKPDIAIYERHAGDFALTPEATLFIDDTTLNVEGARVAGWNAVRFVDAKTLKADLERFGLLS
ncbi:MAG: HAD family hydrolase [Pararhizobium sp.]